MRSHDEAWLLTLVEGMPQMIWRAHERGDWTWCSPQWTRHTGQTPEESAGSGWLNVVHPEDRPAAVEAWARAPDTGELRADMRIKGPDGGYKWFQTRAKPVLDADRRVVEWIGTSTDVNDLRQLEDEQKVLVAELQHRTRNLIAVIHSIAGQTLRTAASLQAFGERFDDRLAALSRVQGLLSTSEHDPITIERLIQLELGALAPDRVATQVQMNGPRVLIRNSTAQTMALAIHELSTNALKYGALSSEAGRIAISWSEEKQAKQRWLNLIWEELGLDLSASAGASSHGNGRVLIEKALPRQLGAKTKMTFHPGGMRCSIRLPLKHYQAGDTYA